MTDRIHSLTVVLEENIRDDDVQPIIDAISMVRCVQKVTPIVADHEAHMAESRAHQAWADLFYDILRVSRDFTKMKKLRHYLKGLREE